MTKVLQVMTSHDQLGDTGRKTGYWASELTHAYREFDQAGYEIELASINGGTPPLDPLSDRRRPYSLSRDCRGI
jgi:putative intracellular protease/amidase